jgi:DNA primase
MTKKTEIERAILKEAIKKLISRINSLQKQLETEKEERKEMGGYEDCGQFYQDNVMKTEAKISELISQKISFEKWRKKLSYE